MNISGINTTMQSNSPNFGMYKVDTKGFTKLERMVLDSADTQAALSDISKDFHQTIRKVWVVLAGKTEKVFPSTVIGRLKALRFFNNNHVSGSKSLTPGYEVHTRQLTKTKDAPEKDSVGSKAVVTNLLFSYQNIKEAVASAQKDLLKVARDSRAKYAEKIGE